MIYAENILICITVPLLITLLFIKGNTRRFIVSFLTGMAVFLLAAYISGFISILDSLGESDTMIFISPIIEEIMALLPILFYLFLFEPEDISLFLVGLGIGAGFATFENCCYILTYGADNLTYMMIRGLAVGVMHIICELILVFALVISRHYNMLSLSGIMGALSLSMIFHALYNLLVSEPGFTSYIGYSLPLFTATLLYIPYRKFQDNLH